MLILFSRLRDPKGGLTAAGRRHYKRKFRNNLKPGVKKPVSEMSPGEMRRKGSFLRRHYTGKMHPLKTPNGKPTRYALQAHAWGEPIPKTSQGVQRLAARGKSLLARYKRRKKK